ncbi:MAG: hypothetical protein V4585_12810 [Bacteroidota bacterium]
MKTDIRNILAIKTKQALSSNILNSSNIRQNIIILDELQSFIPPLSSDEYAQLASNILQHGCQTPLQVWQTLKKNLDLPFEKEDDLAYILVDGHNRYKICTQHNLPFEVYVLSFESQKDAKDYMINLQLGRRNLSQNQISYFRGLRYNNEKADKFDNLQANSSKGQNDPSVNEGQITNDLSSFSPKGQNDPSIKRGDMADNLQTNSPKGQNDPSVKTTAERLAKEYNVSPKTIKRDAEFADGLEKIDPELRNNILEGKTKIDKGTIQKLSKSQIKTPIKSIHELHEIADKPDAGSVVSKEIKLSARVRESVKNADDFDLTITIKGSFLIKNGLESIWRELRGFSDEIVIDESFTDTISIYQAPILGIIDRL